MGLVSHHLWFNLQFHSWVPLLGLLWSHSNGSSTTCPLPEVNEIPDILHHKYLAEATAISMSPERMRMYLQLHQGYHDATSGRAFILLPGKFHQLFCKSAGASCIPPETQLLQNPDTHLRCFAVTVRQGWIYHFTNFAHTRNVLFMQDNNQA